MVNQAVMEILHQHEPEVATHLLGAAHVLLMLHPPVCSWHDLSADAF
jgi:hypothetical protein